MPTADSFDALFDRYTERMQRVAIRLVGSYEIAAEIVQDVFLKLWTVRGTLDLNEDMAAYLASATRNRALDWLAREEMHRNWEETVRRAEIVADESAANHDSQELSAHEPLKDALSEVLAAMPAKRREVCRLRWYDGLGPKAIAAQLGIAVKTVETQLSRGKEALRARITD